jgi:hypothetical protein
MKNDIFLPGSPYGFVETDSIQFKLVWRKGAVITIDEFWMYLGAKDVTADCLTGAGSVDSNVVLTPVIAGWKGQNDYVFGAVLVVDGLTLTRKAIFRIQKKSAKVQ